MKPKPKTLLTRTASRKLNGKPSVRGSATSKLDARQWQKRCSQLEKECHALRRQVAELRAQRAEYSGIICDLVYGDDRPEIDEDEISAELEKLKSGKAQTMEQLIQELQQSDAPGKKKAKKRSTHGK